MTQKIKIVFSSLYFWLIAINVLTFVFMLTQGVSPVSPSTEELMKWGGNLAPLTLNGEGWRLLTSMFQHGGIVHLLLNMYMLFQIGFISELIWGRWRFLVLYLVCGLVGSLSSALWYSKASQYVVSVGASGALMGLAGACLVQSLYQEFRKTDHSSLLKLEWKAVLQVIVINLGMGFAIPGVDNACHMGGLAAGIGAAVIFTVPFSGSLHVLENLKTFLIVILSSGILYGGFKSPRSEKFLELSRLIKIELQAEKLKQDRLRLRAQREKINWDEQKNLPQPVSLEEAQGESFAVEGGSHTIVYSVNRERAYVPNTQENSLSILDLQNFKILKTIKGPHLPEIKNTGCPDNLCLGRGASGVAVSKDEKWALVSSMKPDEVVWLDLESGQIQGSVKVGRFPRDLVLSLDEKWAFVINSVDNSLSVLDVVNKTLKWTKDLNDSGYGGQGQSFGRPLSLLLLPEKNQVVVADGVIPQLVVVSSTQPDDILKRIPMGEFLPHEMNLSPDGKYLWVLGWQNYEAHIKILDTQSFSQLEEWFVCWRNIGAPSFSFSPDGKYVVMDEYWVSRLRVVSLASFKTVRLLPGSNTGGAPLFSKDGSRIFFYSSRGWQASLTRLDFSKTLDIQNHVDEHGEMLCEQ